VVVVLAELRQVVCVRRRKESSSSGRGEASGAARRYRLSQCASRPVHCLLSQTVVRSHVSA
jgi:hypothetical protein